MTARDSTQLARHALEQVCSRNDPEDQVTEGDRVASRWVAQGHNRGRPIRIWGIVISRIEDGEIVEDWADSDNLHLIRQLGAWRLLLLGVEVLRQKRQAYRA